MDAIDEQDHEQFDESALDAADLDNADTTAGTDVLVEDIADLDDEAAVSSDIAPATPDETGEQDEALLPEEIAEIDDESLEVEQAPVDAADVAARAETDVAEEIAELDDTTDADERAESDSDGDGRAAIESLHGMGFVSIERLDGAEKSHSDREIIRHGAESYAHTADLLERQVALLEQRGEATKYRSHFLGEFNEIGSQAPFEKWGDMQNLNDPAKKHDNYQGVDLRFANASGTINFEADAKASLSARPLDYYWGRLKQIEAGNEAAELFVPYDHEYALKERIDARVEAGKMDELEATRWKDRIHAAAFSSAQYGCILEQCAADDKPDYISTEKARQLVGQLRAASAYAKQQIEDV